MNLGIEIAAITRINVAINYQFQQRNPAYVSDHSNTALYGQAGSSSMVSVTRIGAGDTNIGSAG